MHHLCCYYITTMGIQSSHNNVINFRVSAGEHVILVSAAESSVVLKVKERVQLLSESGSFQMCKFTINGFIISEMSLL